MVSTRSEEVIAARSGVFELLLVNHPSTVLCATRAASARCRITPIRSDPTTADGFPRRVRRRGRRGDVDFGPALMLNRQRCIMHAVRPLHGRGRRGCDRRGEPGYGSEIATFRDEGVHSLISGNLMDVCPVGAITTRQYCSSRAWDNPNVADTICTMCSKG